MSGCDRCRGDDNLAYNCNYCSGSFCSQHRLPENHNCPGLKTARTQGPDFRALLNTDTGILGRVFGDDNPEDAIAREHHTGMKEYDGSLEPGVPAATYTPDTSSPDVNPDGSIKQQDVTPDSTGGERDSRMKTVGATFAGLCILAATFPVRVLFNLPTYLQSFNRWLAQLLESLYSLVRTLTPIAAILIAGVFVAGLVGTGIPAVDQTAQDGADTVGSFFSTDNGQQENDIEQAVHAEVNQVRSDRGLNTVAFDHTIAKIARNHSEDMAERDYFRHTNPDGENAQDRLRAASVSCRAGENLYYHEGYGTQPEQVAERVVESWLDSPGHRENLLRRGWTAEGIGVEVQGDEVWVTQVFC